MLTRKRSGWGQQEASRVVTFCVRTRLSAGRQQREGMKHFKRQIVRRKWFFGLLFFFSQNDDRLDFWEFREEDAPTGERGEGAKMECVCRWETGCVVTE